MKHRNKVDLLDQRVITIEQGAALASMWNVPFLETRFSKILIQFGDDGDDADADYVDGLSDSWSWCSHDKSPTKLFMCFITVPRLV